MRIVKSHPLNQRSSFKSLVNPVRYIRWNHKKPSLDASCDICLTILVTSSQWPPTLAR